MKRLRRGERAMAASLSAVAGFVDAVGFLTLGGFFVSFMSGNSTRLAAGLAQGEFETVAVAGALILLFVVGVALGSAAGHYAGPRRRPVVLATVTVLLVVAAVFASILADGRAAMAFATMAMGAANALFERDGEVAVGLTYMTGTLVKLGQRLVASVLRYGERGAWRPHLIHWLALAFGAVAGALAYRLVDSKALWVAAAVSAVATVLAHRSKIEAAAG
jgi:uncharacterized membrane protein YoaK (UPF0700 family)